MSYLRFVSRVRPEVTGPDAPCVDRPRLLDQNLLPDPSFEGWLGSGPLAYPPGEGPGHIPIWNASFGSPQGLHYQTLRGTTYDYEPAPQDPWPQVSGQVNSTATAWIPNPENGSDSWVVDESNPRTGSANLHHRFIQGGGSGLVINRGLYVMPWTLCDVTSSIGNKIPYSGVCRSGDEITLSFWYSWDRTHESVNGGGGFGFGYGVVGFVANPEVPSGWNILWQKSLAPNTSGNPWDASGTGNASVGWAQRTDTVVVPDGFDDDHLFRWFLDMTTFKGGTAGWMTLNIYVDDLDLRVTSPAE